MVQGWEAQREQIRKLLDQFDDAMRLFNGQSTRFTGGSSCITVLPTGEQVLRRSPAGHMLEENYHQFSQRFPSPEGGPVPWCDQRPCSARLDNLLGSVCRFVLNAKWWALWKAHVSYDSMVRHRLVCVPHSLVLQQPPLQQAPLQQPPGPVDNSALVQVQSAVPAAVVPPAAAEDGEDIEVPLSSVLLWLCCCDCAAVSWFTGSLVLCCSLQEHQTESL